MKMKKFAYVFSCAGRVMWSSEDQDTLPKRAENKEDASLIAHFIEKYSVGSFISLSTGEMIFRTE